MCWQYLKWFTKNFQIYSDELASLANRHHKVRQLYLDGA